MRYNESAIQRSLMTWWSVAHRSLGVPHRELLMAFPLQGKRTLPEGGRLKQEGMRKGTPDMLLAVPRGHYGGLWIELKTLTGRLTSEQHTMLCLLIGAGYHAVVARGWDQARAEIESYLKGAK
jgi:hypothetical protein